MPPKNGCWSGVRNTDIGHPPLPQNVALPVEIARGAVADRVRGTLEHGLGYSAAVVLVEKHGDGSAFHGLVYNRVHLGNVLAHRTGRSLDEVLRIEAHGFT